jgi:antibiotic biosynthesis monooxygenase (ABM) superfamily enzyme
MSARSRGRFLARPRLAQVAMTLGAWLVAFGVVLTLLALFGDELKSLPLPLRALVISGVLVALMINLVMPVLNAVIERWLSGRPISQQPRERTMPPAEVRPDGG